MDFSSPEKPSPLSPETHSKCTQPALACPLAPCALHPQPIQMSNPITTIPFQPVSYRL